MKIMKAEQKDLPEILLLQKTAYQSEAKLVNDFTIEPLTQTLQGLEEDFQNGILLKAVIDNKIVGSVRGIVKDNTLLIGRLMVDPDYQNKGIGSTLLKAIEEMHPNLQYELFTSAMSEKNLSLYTKRGYKEFKRESLNETITLVFLEKQPKKENQYTYMMFGLSIGMCLGVAFGTATHGNLAIGISMGMCIGLGIGALIDYSINKK